MPNPRDLGLTVMSDPRAFGCPLGMGAMSDLRALGLTSMHTQ